jgi:kumamolisin
MSNALPHGYMALVGSERNLPVQARQLASVDPQEQLEVSLYLRPPAGGDLTSLLQQRTESGVPHLGPHLTRVEYLARRGATAEDIAAVELFAQDHQLTVVRIDQPARRITLSGTVAQINSAFALEIQHYALAEGTFRGHSGPINLPQELSQIVVGVFGIDNFPLATPHIRYAQEPAAGTSFSPHDVASLYNFPLKNDGKGQTVGIIELGGGYRSRDLQTYFRQQNVHMPNVVSVSVDGARNSPTGDPYGADGEVDLDIEIVGAIALGSTIAVYFAPNSEQGFVDAITSAIHDTTHHPSVLSISWGAPEDAWTSQGIQAMDQAFQDAAALGVSVCCAAGDGGSGDGEYDGQAHVDFPASSPHALACGGTTLTVGQNKTISETVWNNAPNSATGGGVSDVFALPSWQTNANVPPSANDQHSGRGVPDIAGDADPNTGYRVYADGSNIVVGGTSAVAPLWAALIALINQQRKQSLGYLNPVLYQHASLFMENAAFHDVTDGDNGAYQAAPGWDACTGFGSPNGAALLKTLQQLTTPGMKDWAAEE